MKTRNSIDLLTGEWPCSQLSRMNTCLSMKKAHGECGSPGCPFYKPISCDDWIRVEDEDGINLIPPEEYEELRKRQAREKQFDTWKVSWGSA